MPAQQLNILPKVPTGHTMVVGWPIISVHLRIRCWHRPLYLIYVLGNLALYGIEANQWIIGNDVITLYLLRKTVKRPHREKILST